jgi:spore maturation protein SpmA
VLNWIFLILIGASVLTAAFTGTMPKVTAASLNSAKAAVDLAIGLVGQMALWLGFMGVLREAGLMRSIARGLKPVMVRLFPDVPPEHPGMGAMIMNLAANVLGLGNAATPFGIKAMVELNKLNRYPGVSTNAMALFLAINTSGVAVLPLGAVAVRAALGSKNPAGIIVPTLLATMLSTATAVLIGKLLEKRPRFAPEKYYDASTAPAGEAEVKSPDAAKMAEAEAIAAPRPGATGWRLAIEALVLGAMGFAVVRYFAIAPPEQQGFEAVRGLFSDWLLPVLMLLIVIFGFGRQVKVYEVFVASAKEGFQIAITIIPFLVAIIVAIGMFRESGAMNALVSVLSPVMAWVGFPPEALPMALIRPLSGSGALAVMSETMKTYGPDSFVGFLVSVINGSQETTFYVLALYFGSVHVRAIRHTLVICLLADLAGVTGALIFSRIFWP